MESTRDNIWIKLTDREPEEGEKIIMVVVDQDWHRIVYFGGFHMSALKMTRDRFDNLYWVPLPEWSKNN